MILPDPVILFAGIVASATPVIIAVIGETISEKAGVINLSLDGTILLSAMTAFSVAYQTQSILIGIGAGTFVGGIIGAGIAALSLYCRVSQVAIGFVCALMAKDLAYFLGNAYARLNGPQIGDSPLPFLRHLPVVGPILFNHNILVYCSLLLIPLSTWFLFYTRMGLTLRAVGENPLACYARGIRPQFHQIVYSGIGGALVGLSGASFALCFKPGWGRPQGAEGTGWIVLALVIFGGWNPIRACMGAYLFAFLQVAAIYLQNRFDAIPAQIFQVAPFPLMISTLLVIQLVQQDNRKKNVASKGVFRKFLAILSGSAPASLGKSFL